MSNFCHPENPGSSHWLGCACHESAWAEKLAAAEREARVNADYGHTAALRMNRIRQIIGDTTRDGFEYSAAEIARAVLAECDMPMEPELRRLIAAEERARRLEGALVDYLEWGAMTGSDRDLFTNRFRTLLGRPEGYYCDGCRSNVPTSKHEGCRYYTEKPARAALAPPPEAAPAYRQMTPEEDAAQRRSFAYGNAKLANEDVTREMLNPPPEAEKRGEDE